MIIPLDIKEKVNELFNEYKQGHKSMTHEMIRDSPLICGEMLEQLISQYELQDSHFDRSSKYLLEELLTNYIEDIVNEFNNRKMMKKGLNHRLGKLKELKLPEQRSKEWYAIRDTMLTASSLADALGKGHFKTKEALIIEHLNQVCLKPETEFEIF